jgi:hypothetical protein
MWHCIWEKEFESYKIWNSSPLYYEFLGHPFSDMEKIFKYYLERQPLGKWYPSNDDSMTSRQKKLLPNVSYSSRKAEFMIEDTFYKNLIEKDWINGENNDLKKLIDNYYQ